MDVMPLFAKRSKAAVHHPGRDAQVTPELPARIDLPPLEEWVARKYPWAVADRNEFRRFANDLMEYILKDRLEMTSPLRRLAVKADVIVGKLSNIKIPDELPADATLADVIASLNEIRAAIAELSIDRESG